MSSATYDARPVDRSRISGFTPFERYMFIISICLLYLSDQILENLGIPYGSAQGNPLTKLHPCAYFLFAAFFSVLFRQRFYRVAALNPHAMIFAYVMIAITLIQGLLKGEGQLTNYIFSFIVPAIYVTLFPLLSEREQKLIFKITIAFYVVNSLTGLAELVTGRHLFTLYLDGVPFDEVRSTAFGGHPLSNALNTAFAGLIAFAYLRNLIVKVFCVLVMLASQLAFQGRVATVMMLIGLAALVGHSLLRMAQGQRISSSNFLFGFAGVFVGPLLGIYVAFGTSLGESFLSRFADDNGSASTRIGSIDIINLMTWEEKIIGASPSRGFDMQSFMGLIYGIENMWVSLFFKFGLLLFIPFCIVFFLFLRGVVRRHSFVSLVCTMVLIVGLSSSVGLSTKSSLLSLFCVMMMSGATYARRPERISYAEFYGLDDDEAAVGN